IAETDRQIQVEGERLLRQLDNDASVAGDRLVMLSANLDQAKKMASQSCDQTGLSEKTRNSVDRGLRRFHALGGVHSDWRAARGSRAVIWLCVGPGVLFAAADDPGCTCAASCLP